MTTSNPVPKLLAVGLNPARQKTLSFERFTPGQVNRATALAEAVGGKGAHCCRAIQTLAPGAVTLAQFLGGENGAFVARELAAAGIRQLTVPTAGETRVCTTVLDGATGQMTELIEPAPPIAPAETAALLARVLEVLPEMQGVALCGTFPPGVGPECYAQIAAHKGRAVLLLDGYRGVRETLTTGQVDILKINVDEVCALTGEPDAAAAVAHCFATWRVGWVALTDGPRPARLCGPEGVWRYELPELAVRNPLGAGDTATGVLLLKVAAGLPVPEAFHWALAAATASCLNVAPAVFTPAAVRELQPRIRCIPEGRTAAGTAAR